MLIQSKIKIIKGIKLSINITKEESLHYHEKGKIGIEITKPCNTQRELSMAYTPGVADPCIAISENKELAYKYTNKANLVAVITDSTAVLGLGELNNPEAGKPVMEGKAVLFKKFGLIDAYDIEVDEKDPTKFVEIARAISPTFGGINLEDIKAPKCFEIEKALQEAVDIPIMHDDQHGTAIITTAALLNALDIAGKNAKSLKVVISGAGAASISCARMYKKIGVKHIVMVDSKGVISTSRDDLNKYKAEFAIETGFSTLAQAIQGSDMFLGLSRGGILTKEMVQSMESSPIIFALSNPTPEIFPHEVKEVRDDAIIATGRSDYPNQVNNVLGFPFIFRGALDVRAKKVTENMKMAAAKALANLAKKNIPSNVKNAYNDGGFHYGREHIIPTPFNRYAYVEVSSAVAQAAYEDGVARVKSFNIKEYKQKLCSDIECELY